MLRRWVFGFFSGIQDFLNRPLKVVWLCLALVFVNLVVDGSLLRLWSLHRDHGSILKKSSQIQGQLAEIESKIQQASHPSFIEKEARDRFDLVEKGDLVFVFSEE